MRKSVRIIGLVALLVLLVAAPVDMMAQKRGKAQKRKAKTERTTKGKAASGEQTFTVNGVSFTMIHVQGGTFTMGATSEQGSYVGNNEKPAHKVAVSSFLIGKFEVTQYLWTAVMGNNPSKLQGIGMLDLLHPVENVSWDDCQEFIRKLNAATGKHFRLPTEAEWEYAARGGNKSRGYKYSGSNIIDDVAAYANNSVILEALNKEKLPFHGTVGTLAPNELGIYDMSGNVWEWCQDWYGEDYYSNSPSSNPTGPSTGSNRVNRGGSWQSSAVSCRVSCRIYDSADLRSRYIGLRLAL